MVATNVHVHTHTWRHGEVFLVCLVAFMLASHFTGTIATVLTHCRYLPVSQGAIGTHKSKWSACAQDVAWGNIDFCIGNTWATEARLEIVSEGAASLLTAAYHDQFKLLVPTTKTQTVHAKQEIGFLSAPFSLESWLIVLAAFILISVLYMLSDFMVDMLREHRFAQLEESKQKNLKPTTLRKWFSVAKLIYNFKKTFLEFCGGSAEMFDDFNVDKQKPIASTIAKIGWGVFVCITIALYEANLTANLVNGRSKTVSLIDSLEACVERDCNLCIHESQTSEIDSLLRGLDVVKDDYPQTLNEARKRTHVVALESRQLAEVIATNQRHKAGLTNSTLQSLKSTWTFTTATAPESEACSASDKEAYNKAVQEAEAACLHVGGIPDLKNAKNESKCVETTYHGCARPAEEAIRCDAFVYDVANAGMYLNEAVLCTHAFQGPILYSFPVTQPVRAPKIKNGLNLLIARNKMHYQDLLEEAGQVVSTTCTLDTIDTSTSDNQGGKNTVDLPPIEFATFIIPIGLLAGLTFLTCCESFYILLVQHR